MVLEQYSNPDLPTKVLYEINSGKAFKEIYQGIYNERFGLKIPLKITCTASIESNLAKFFPEYKGIRCISGIEYYVTVNSYGLVSAIFDKGITLALKPNEFEVIEYHTILPNIIITPSN